MLQDEGNSRGWWSGARVYLIPALVLLSITVPFLHRGDWKRTDSGKYGAIGVQAWRTGNLWTLQAEPGHPYFNKPPLAIWIHGLSLRVLGVHAWGARLPSLLTALGCLAVTIAMMRRWTGDWAAVWIGIVLALSYDFFRRTRAVSLDLWQLFFLLLAMWAIAHASGVVDRARWRRGLGFALAGVPLGLGLLCKPLAASLFIPLAGTWLAWTRGWPAATWLAATLVVAVAVAAPWHLSMYALHGDLFLEQYFGQQVAARAAGDLTAAPFDAKPLWYYATHFASTHWPWLACVVLALGSWWRAGRLSQRGEAERWALVWTLGWLVALSAFADRRDRYAIPVMPSMAALAGLWLAGLPVPSWVNWRTLGRSAALLVVIAPLGALIPVGGEDTEPVQWRALYEWIDAQRLSRDGRPLELWQGGFSLDRGARVYLRYGFWARTTRDELARSVVDRDLEPPEGAFLLYHQRDGLAPGPNETETFRSGDLVVTRLGTGGWRPVTLRDGGEHE